MYSTGMESRKWRRSNLLMAMFLIIGLLSFGVGTSSAKADAPPVTSGWHNTGIDVSGYLTCIDGAHLNTAIYSQNDGTYALNWQTGQKTKISTRKANYCDQNNGWIFDFNNSSQIVRFNAENPDGQVISSVGTFANDGRPIYYRAPGSFIAVEGIPQIKPGSIEISRDFGTTWTNIAPQWTNKVQSLAVSQANSYALYALIDEGVIGDNDGHKYSLHYSDNAGASWGKVNDFTVGRNRTLYIASIPGRSTPVTMVMLQEIDRETTVVNLKVSADLGRTFNRIGDYAVSVNPIYNIVSVYHTGNALFRANTLFYSNDGPAVSYDNGVTWQPVDLPVQVNTGLISVIQFPNSPSNLLNYKSYGGQGDLYHSGDGGLTWQKLGESLDDMRVTPYAPTTLIGTKNGKLYTYDLTATDKNIAGPVVPNQSFGGNYYAGNIKHNLSQLFRAYWETKGGLSLFGYPKTELFREYNPADGKIYFVQYLERNRFEYHPENAGTPYEVLLGLLGNQLTEARKAAGEGAFRYFENANYPGGTYFPQTGHNLRNSFKAYWEAHGGLAIFGYAISEEFEEVNPDDGQTYIVQYFERNRFEYHPKNKGTPYEVELGLLGNTLLQQKGWLN